MRRLVVPGDLLDAKKVEGNVYQEGGRYYASMVGLFDKKDNVGKFIPLGGKYVPSPGDYVIGVITDVRFNGYVVDINSPYMGFLSSRREYDYHDVLFVKVNDINEVKAAFLTDDRRLIGGEIIEILPSRVPRVIGRKSSMLNMLREMTGCEIIVGRNGRIWLKGGNLPKAIEAILVIEKEAHTSGLTDRIKKLLEGV